MSTKTKLSTLAMAAAAALLFSAAPMTAVQAATGSDAKVHCFGVNKCKGHNDCKTASNACKGHASCKGKGFVSMSDHACSEIGGKVK